MIVVCVLVPMILFDKLLEFRVRLESSKVVVDRRLLFQFWIQCQSLLQCIECLGLFSRSEPNHSKIIQNLGVLWCKDGCTLLVQQGLRHIASL